MYKNKKKCQAKNIILKIIIPKVRSKAVINNFILNIFSPKNKK
ncbi:MAG: hypothetical protein ABID79_00420 [Elusimicrobiota bacterium]